MYKVSKADVEPIRQLSQYSCMSSSLMMCIRANGLNVQEQEVNDVMGARPMKGASWEQALACAQHYGMRGTLISPATVGQLKEFTDRKVPVMISWNPEGREWSHASVVFDVVGDNIHIADPNIPNPEQVVRIVSKDEFYGKWAEEWPNYLVRRVAMAIEREITEDGRQVVASENKAMDTSAWDRLSFHPQTEGRMEGHLYLKPELKRILEAHLEKTAALAQDAVGKALKAAGLKFSKSRGGGFLISNLGSKASDMVDITPDGDSWKANVGNKSVSLKTPGDATKLAWELKKKQEAHMSKNAAWDQLSIHPHVAAMVEVKSDDKESKFERGEDVPVSELPEELQENVKNPPPSVQKVKEKIKNKNKDKEAARAPSGLYGFTKSIQADCVAATNKLHKVAARVAVAAVGKDHRVANFWQVHAKRNRSGSAKMLLAALEASRKLASDNGMQIPMGREAADKEAGFGYYGFPKVTAHRALGAIGQLREETGVISADLHYRRATLHDKITGFFQNHAKQTKCGASRMLFDSYPEANMKLASEPDTVNDWLTWEPEQD